MKTIRIVDQDMNTLLRVQSPKVTKGVLLSIVKGHIFSNRNDVWFNVVKRGGFREILFEDKKYCDKYPFTELYVTIS